MAERERFAGLPSGERSVSSRDPCRNPVVKLGDLREVLKGEKGSRSPECCGILVFFARVPVGLGDWPQVRLHELVGAKGSMLFKALYPGSFFSPS